MNFARFSSFDDQSFAFLSALFSGVVGYQLFARVYRPARPAVSKEKGIIHRFFRFCSLFLSAAAGFFVVPLATAIFIDLFFEGSPAYLTKVNRECRTPEAPLTTCRLAAETVFATNPKLAISISESLCERHYKACADTALLLKSLPEATPDHRQQAQKYLDRALSFEPRNPIFLQAQAKVHAAFGDYAMATESQRRAIQELPAHASQKIRSDYQANLEKYQEQTRAPSSEPEAQTPIDSAPDQNPIQN